jgi:hypothetical protein
MQHNTLHVLKLGLELMQKEERAKSNMAAPAKWIVTEPLCARKSGSELAVYKLAIAFVAAK